MGIKFGANVNQNSVSWGELLSLWRELDSDSNFDQLWVSDHLVTGLGSGFAHGECMEGWTTLAALAQATSRVRLGVLVSGNTYRHPAVLAKMGTTVDHISGGRLEFGLGGAWHAYEHRAFGIPFYTVRERLERLDEAAQVVKLLWTQPQPAFQGRYYQLDGPPYMPPNLQQPHPPIMVGGGGEKRTLCTVAKYADAANVEGSPEQVRHKFRVLEQHCRDVGRDYSTIRRTIQVALFLSEDTALQQRVVQGIMGIRGMAEEDARRSVFLGSVDDVKGQVREFVEVGVQEIVVAQFPRSERESLLRFSGEVIPAFR